MNLKIYLDTEKPWLDPGFSVQNLLTEYNRRTNQFIVLKTITKISRNHFGKSLMYVLNEYRVNYAVKLIQKGYSGKLEYLHEECGFVTQASLYKWFRRFKKMTPGEYRNKWRFNRVSLANS